VLGFGKQHRHESPASILDIEHMWSQEVLVLQHLSVLDHVVA
jgi:hypothetical protein